MKSALSHELVLYGGPTSPFSRMAYVLGIELGLDFAYVFIDVYNAEFLDRFNPLRQIPTLVIDGEHAVFDSRAIFSYLDSISAGPSVIPDSDHRHATRVSLLLGLTEACLHYRMETIRPEGERSGRVIEKQAERMKRCIVHLENLAEEITQGDLRLEQVVAACALEYVDFRYSNDWRRTSPRLDFWLNSFSTKPGMVESRPSE